MLRRWICILLAALMLFGIVSMVALQAHAASVMKASENCIALIKQLEGFLLMPKLDYSQYSVGYGSACNPDDYPNGITEEEADALLRKDVADFEASVNKFADKYNLAFSQQQFDALISFTYNVGSNWMNDSEGMFRNAVVNRQTGNDFLFAIARWSAAGTGDNKTIQVGLVERRLIEANLYLNGVYSDGVPANYTYVIYNTNISDCTNTIRVQAYDSTVGDTVKATPTKSGYRFLGWYTAANGGKWITNLNTSTAGLTLYAHWQLGDGSLDADGNPIGVTADYSLYSSADGDQIVRAQPSADAAEVKKLGASVEVSIVADYMDSNGTKWGKLSGGGWISLTEATEEVEPAEPLEEPLLLTVTHDDVNIRSGPGTNHMKVGKAYLGQQLTITAVQKGGQYLWGKFTSGWICLDYTDYEIVISEMEEDSQVVTAIGTVIRTSKVNVRSGPGTNYAVSGTLKRGETVQITQEKNVGGKLWYKTEIGWIHSYYLQVTPVVSETPDAETPTDPTEPETPAEPETPTEPDDSGDSAGDKPEVIDTGTVFNCSTLRVRAGAGTKYDHVGDLVRGTKVQIYDYALVGSAVWGRIDQGWVHMSYIKLDETVSGDSDAVTATVVNCTKLNVRSGPGTGYSKVGQLTAGERVQVLQLMQLSSGKVWARISQGWVHTDYLKLDGTIDSGDSGSSDSGNSDSGNSDSGSEDSGTTAPDAGSSDIVTGGDSAVILTGTIVKTDSLRVRSGPGTGYEHIADLPGGARVEILEQTIVNRTTWGRTQYGWISLYYVQLDTATSVEGAVTKTVNTDTLRIRAGAGTGYEHVGNYYRGNIVVILEQTTVNGRPWGRTDLGWICLEYVK